MSKKGLVDMVPKQMLKPPEFTLEEIQQIVDDLNLSPLRLRYVYEYAKCGNYAQALRNAGSKATGKNVHWQVYHFNKNPQVTEALRRIENLFLQRVYEQAEAIKLALGKIAFADITDYITWTEDSLDLKPSELLLREGVDTTPIKSISVSHTRAGKNIKIDFYDKLDALKTLAKISGILKDRVELTGADGGPIKIDHQIRAQLQEVYGVGESADDSSTQPVLDAEILEAEFQELPPMSDDDLEEAAEYVEQLIKDGHRL